MLGVKERVSKWVGVLWVHLFVSWGFVVDELRDKPASDALDQSIIAFIRVS